MKPADQYPKVETVLIMKLENLTGSKSEVDIAFTL